MNPIGEAGVVMFGVEIETEYVTPAALLSSRRFARNLLGGVVVKDLTLTSGFEFVTRPFTLNSWETHDDCADIRLWLDGTLVGRREGNAGGHIHVSRTAFDDDAHLGRFVSRLVEVNGDETVRPGWFRQGSRYARWDQIDFGARLARFDTGVADAAVNMWHPHTVELRFGSWVTSGDDLTGRLRWLAGVVEDVR